MRSWCFLLCDWSVLWKMIHMLLQGFSRSLQVIGVGSLFLLCNLSWAGRSLRAPELPISRKGQSWEHNGKSIQGDSALRNFESKLVDRNARVEVKLHRRKKDGSVTLHAQRFSFRLKNTLFNVGEDHPGNAVFSLKKGWEGFRFAQEGTKMKNHMDIDHYMVRLDDDILVSPGSLKNEKGWQGNLRVPLRIFLEEGQNISKVMARLKWVWGAYPESLLSFSHREDEPILSNPKDTRFYVEKERDREKLVSMSRYDYLDEQEEGQLIHTNDPREGNVLFTDKEGAAEVSAEIPAKLLIDWMK